MTPAVYAFTVPGNPVGKARARVVLNRGKVRAFTPDKTARFENLVRMAFASAYPNHVPVRGAISLSITALFEPPKSMRFKGVVEQTPHTKRPDADNVLKAIADGLNGVAFRDDSQVAHAVCRKAYSYVPRTVVIIQPIQPQAKEGKA
jgi:Holliday junction resolvase RusA-like endonuclease